MRTVKSQCDEHTGAISGRILLLPLGAAGSRTLFGIESQRDHVRAGLVEALVSHRIEATDLVLPKEAHLLPGEEWGLTTTDLNQRAFRIVCWVSRTWTNRPILRFKARPQ